MQDRQREIILRDVCMHSTSMSWCYTEMQKVLSRLQQLENSKENISEKDVAEYSKLDGQMMYLCGKAFFERRLLLALREKLKNRI